MPNALAEMMSGQNQMAPIMAVTNPRGLKQAGNIDLYSRPIVRNRDGSMSTVRSVSFMDDDGLEVLVPSVSPDGRVLTDLEAWQLYRSTGQHLGKFADPDSATEYAKSLHQQQERLYRDR